mgnify:CR=1 FL=1
MLSSASPAAFVPQAEFGKRIADRSNIQDNSYWTSSTVVLFPTYGWHVDMHSGSVDGDAKINTASVWPVKGGL